MYTNIGHFATLNAARSPQSFIDVLPRLLQSSEYHHQASKEWMKVINIPAEQACT